MSQKKRDNHNRWRSITIAFRVSPQDNEQINQLVALTGLTKQEYLAENMMRHQFTVFASPRVQKALKTYFTDVVQELRRIEKAGDINDEFLAVLKFALTIYDGMGGH